MNGVELKIVGTKDQIGAYALEHAEAQGGPLVPAPWAGTSDSKVVLQILD